MPTYSVNKRAVTHARKLINARQYVLDSDWGDSQPMRKRRTPISRRIPGTSTRVGTSVSHVACPTRPRRDMPLSSETFDAFTDPV